MSKYPGYRPRENHRAQTSLPGCSPCSQCPQHGVSQGQPAPTQPRPGHSAVASPAGNHAHSELGHTLAPTGVEPRGCGWAPSSENSPEGQGVDFEFQVCVLHCSGCFHCFCFLSGLLLLNLHQRDAGVKGKCGRHWQRKMPLKNCQPPWA